LPKATKDLHVKINFYQKVWICEYDRQDKQDRLQGFELFIFIKENPSIK